MPRIYENAKQNFSSFDEFKEVATKTLNEIFGRVRPLDVIDFSYTATTYKALGYYEDEVIPAGQEPGEPQSDEAIEAERLAREGDEENRRKAAEEVTHEELRLKALFADKQPVSFEDLTTANRLNIEIPAEILDQLVAAVKTGRMSYEAAFSAGLKEVDGVPTLEAAKALLRAANETVVANQNAANATLEEKPTRNLPYNVKQVGDKLISDKALELAESKGVDISKIDGTGRDGTIKIDDVKDYIANHAPAKENADEDGNEQSNA